MNISTVISVAIFNLHNYIPDDHKPQVNAVMRTYNNLVGLLPERDVIKPACDEDDR